MFKVTYPLVTQAAEVYFATREDAENFAKARIENAARNATIADWDRVLISEEDPPKAPLDPNEPDPTADQYAYAKAGAWAFKKTSKRA